MSGRIEAFLDWGLKVTEVPGWPSRGGSGFAPVGGIWHWTAAPARARGDAPSLRICVEGRPGVPGPLCQDLMGRSGMIYVIAGRRANHAGKGSSVVVRELAAARADRRSARTRGLADDTVANSKLHGLEVESAGEGLTEGQQYALPRYTAALDELYGWERAERWTHHGGYSARKIDMLAYGDLWTPTKQARRASASLSEEDDDVKRLVHSPDGRIWVVDGIHRRWLTHPRQVELELSLGFVKGEIEKPSVEDWDQLARATKEVV